MKQRFICDSFNLIFVVICDLCKEEYIEETEEGKNNLSVSPEHAYQSVSRAHAYQSVSRAHAATTLPTVKSQRTFKSLW